MCSPAEIESELARGDVFHVYDSARVIEPVVGPGQLDRVGGEAADRVVLCTPSDLVGEVGDLENKGLFA